MHTLHEIGLDLYFTREYLKAGVLVSLLSVWVLVGLFTYLNFYTKRRYFTIWTAAWLFYALWITLSFGFQIDQPLVVMLAYWCIGVSAVFLLWGSQQFLGERIRQAMLGLFMLFLFVWSYFGAFHLRNPLQTEVPFFGLLCLSSLVTAWNFFSYRRKSGFIGATLLSVGFLVWGIFMASYPGLENSEDLVSVALFLSAGIQTFLAVSMIILVLEEVRQTHQTTLKKIQTGYHERAVLRTKVASTEERYRTLFDQANEAIIITNADDFRITELNRAAERLLGISRADTARQSLTAFCQIKNASGPAPETGAEWFQIICRQRPLNLIRKNGGIVPVEVDGARVEFDGRASFQFYLRELTERARLEQQLRQAEKLSALGQMISGVAHELNNPLAVIKGYLELILAHHQLNPQTRADLEKAVQESHRAAKLVGNFLSFAREQPPHRERVNFNSLIERVLELRKFDLMVAGVNLKLDLDSALPETLADPDQFQQILVNLINNALHAVVDVAGSHQLIIKTETKLEMVRVIVEDNGPGVPPELVAKIFEPFFTTKEVGTGTGLGLSIAHSIMTEHKGRIVYHPSSLGGAAFVLEFPKVAELKTEMKEFICVKTNAPTMVETHAEILILDDEPAIAEMLSEMLEIIGYNATICHAPLRALELLGKRHFDVILSDFRMPGMNGQQFYEAVQKRFPSLTSHVVFLTGDLVNDSTRSFLESTGNPHLAKPFQLDTVRQTIAQIIQSHHVEPAAVHAA